MNYMNRINVLDSPKPEWLEIIFHTITGIIGGCAAALPVAIKHKDFALYVIGAYALVGGIAAFVGGVGGYLFIPESPQQSLQVFAFAAFNGVTIPVVLLVFRSVTHARLKTKYGELSYGTEEDEHVPR